jgi:hypothetical protein
VRFNVAILVHELPLVFISSTALNFNKLKYLFQVQSDSSINLNIYLSNDVSFLKLKLFIYRKSRLFSWQYVQTVERKKVPLQPGMMISPRVRQVWLDFEPRLVQAVERKKVPLQPGMMISPRVRQVWLDFESRLIPRYSSSERWKRAVF